MKYYAGIGSRKTPVEILELMVTIATQLAADGYTLRSGGADGADSAFVDGAGSASEIYLPWQGFNNIYDGIVCGEDAILMEIAAQHHPAWSRLKQGVKKLHTRNVAQILGTDAKTPSKFVICWTPGGNGTGGTGQAIRIARAYNVPVRDLGDVTTLSMCKKWLSEKLNTV